MKNILCFAIVLMVLTSCDNSKKKEDENKNEIHEVVAHEVLHVKAYSYIRVKENNEERWIAAPTTPIEIGETYYYGTSMKMDNFESKDLNKTFETVYFVEKISKSSEEASVPLKENPHPINPEATKPIIEKKQVNVQTPSNGISIATLFKNKDTYNNQTITLKGEVTKYNPDIMNMNWLHIQDGTDYNGEFDLTVTTKEEVKVGDVVTIQGKVTLNKDFGAGYVYSIIVENATLIK